MACLMTSGSSVMFCATDFVSALAPSVEMIEMLSTFDSGSAMRRATSGSASIAREASASRLSRFCASASALTAAASASPFARVAAALALPRAVIDSASLTAAVRAASAVC